MRDQDKARLLHLPMGMLTAAGYTLSHLHSWLGWLAGVTAVVYAADTLRLVWLRVIEPRLAPLEEQAAPRVEIPNLHKARMVVALGDDGGRDPHTGSSGTERLDHQASNVVDL